MYVVGQCGEVLVQLVKFVYVEVCDGVYWYYVQFDFVVDKDDFIGQQWQGGKECIDFGCLGCGWCDEVCFGVFVMFREEQIVELQCYVIDQYVVIVLCVCVECFGQVYGLFDQFLVGWVLCVVEGYV